MMPSSVSWTNKSLGIVEIQLVLFGGENSMFNRFFKWQVVLVNSAGYALRFFAALFNTATPLKPFKNMGFTRVYSLKKSTFALLKTGAT